MNCSEKLKDPRWQKLRLEVFDRDEWACQGCGDSENTLNVHHTYYEALKEPWEYPLRSFVTLCEECHLFEKEDRPPAEKSLLFAIKKQGFMAKDVLEIAVGFNYIKQHYYAPEVTASIIKWVLGSPGILKVVGDLFFRSLKRENN